MRINRPSCDLLNTNAIVIASLRNISTSFRRCFKSVTSSFRQRRFVSISAQFSLFLICCIVTSSAESHARAAMGLHTQELMTALRLREHTDSVAEQDGGSWPQNHVDKSRCGACAFSRTLNDLSADALLRAHELSSLGKRASSAHTRSLLRRCGFSSFAQYYRLCLAPGLDNNDHKPQNKPTSTDSSSRTDVANKPALARSALTLSRRKRVARGDRRLRRLFSRTQWFLEITADGTVRGSLEKSSTTIIEIQAAGINSVVRFWAPEAGLYLAMNDKGMLYGTENCSAHKCDFVEEMNARFFCTYHSLQRSREHPESKNWYVSIGRSGKPRKAKRLNATRMAVQFLSLHL